MKVLDFPLARITLWFVSGTLFSFYGKPAPQIVFILLAFAFAIFTITYFTSHPKTSSKKSFGIAVYLLSFLIGVTTPVIHTSSYQENNYMRQVGNLNSKQTIEVVLRERLKDTELNHRYVGIITRLDQRESSGKILLNIRKNHFLHEFQIGTHLQLNTFLYQHQKPTNPDQFDYGAYLEKKSIQGYVFTSTSDIKIRNQIDKNIWYYSDMLRSKMIRNLEKSNFNKKELNVLAALILGQRQDISPEVLRDYQYAGAIHILSVSGLHVGFILLFLNSILNFLPKNRRNSYLKLIVILFSLWVFAVIAGLSPSVVRSVTMFSFVAIGMHLHRNTNIFHTLLVSILLILLFQPSFLFDVGFQLSYIALFFILWLQPLLAELWKPRNRILNYFWDILTVSFAAQIGALPLSTYYFHQFPGLFFVTNLIIIPFLSIIMALGIVVMILAAFGVVPYYLSKIVELSIYILNAIINKIASFEQFIIKDIPLNWTLLCSSYILIVAIIIWFKKPDFSKMTVALLAVILIQVTYLKTHLDINNQREWIVFNIKKSTLIAQRNGKNTTVYSFKNAKENEFRNKALNNYLVANSNTLKDWKSLKNTFYFNHQKILIVDSLGIIPQEHLANILILTQSPKINLNRLIKKQKPKAIVADASNFKTYIARWKATCEKEKIPFHATSEKGFYRIVQK